jgi:hypothetical protein
LSAALHSTCIGLHNKQHTTSIEGKKEKVSPVIPKRVPSTSFSIQHLQTISQKIIDSYDTSGGHESWDLLHEALICMDQWCLSQSTASSSIQSTAPTCKAKKANDSLAEEIMLKLLHHIMDRTNQESIWNHPCCCETFVRVLESYIVIIRGTSIPAEKCLPVVLDLLDRVEKMTKFHSNMQPTLKSYNVAMDILSKCKNRQDSIREIEQLMERAKVYCSQLPDATSYNSLLYAISQQGDHAGSSSSSVAAQCEAFLRRMQSNPNTKSLVDSVTYNIVIHAWAKSDSMPRKNQMSFAAMRAESLLLEMQKHYVNGCDHLRPSLVSFTSVIHAWSRISAKDVDAAQRAEHILEMLHESSKVDDKLRPNAYTFHAIMNAWSNSTLPGAARRVEYFLDQMIERFSKGEKGVIPSTISFSIAIKAWARTDDRGNSEKALALLDQMLILSKEGYRTEPDIGTLNSVLRAIANDSSNVEKVSDAKKVLDLIQKMKLRPDLSTYNNVLRCCMTTRSDDAEIRQRSVRLATETLLNIKKTSGISPDPYTFNYFIKVCDRLTLGDEKIKLIKAAFQYCIEAKQFSAPVLSIMKNSLTPQELQSIMGRKRAGECRIDDFPPEWGMGVQKAKSIAKNEIDNGARSNPND